MATTASPVDGVVTGPSGSPRGGPRWAHGAAPRAVRACVAAMAAGGRAAGRVAGRFVSPGLQGAASRLHLLASRTMDTPFKRAPVKRRPSSISVAPRKPAQEFELKKTTKYTKEDIVEDTDEQPSPPLMSRGRFALRAAAQTMVGPPRKALGVVRAAVRRHPWKKPRKDKDAHEDPA
ncbi:unnamed protein product, partial [Meganyctiphanes norvegica]